MRGLSDVDRYPGRHGDEVRYGFEHGRPIDGLPPQPGLLHHVFGFCSGAKHAIRHAK
jgi:hypothetical protein